MCTQWGEFTEQTSFEITSLFIFLGHQISNIINKL